MPSWWLLCVSLQRCVSYWADSWLLNISKWFPIVLLERVWRYTALYSHCQHSHGSPGRWTFSRSFHTFYPIGKCCRRHQRDTHQRVIMKKPRSDFFLGPELDEPRDSSREASGITSQKLSCAQTEHTLKQQRWCIQLAKVKSLMIFVVHEGVRPWNPSLLPGRRVSWHNLCGDCRCLYERSVFPLMEWFQVLWFILRRQ